MANLAQELHQFRPINRTAVFRTLFAPSLEKTNDRKHRRRHAHFQASSCPSGRIAGCYTLASASVLLTDLAEPLAKRMPRYPNVPAVRMGRLAVDRNFKGQGLGAALLVDALRRATTAEIAAYALVVDAKDQVAAEFYAHHGFIATSGHPLLLYLPLGTVKGLIK